VKLRTALREFLFGMGAYEFARHALEERAAMESLFMVITLGDMVGVPVMPPYYSLRLLPHAVPHVDGWKRRALRERSPADRHEFDLHGV